MDILKRKRRDDFNEFALIKRKDGYHPYVVATINEISLKHNEWFWGHYFETLEEATEYFDGCKAKVFG